VGVGSFHLCSSEIIVGWLLKNRVMIGSLSARLLCHGKGAQPVLQSWFHAMGMIHLTGDWARVCFSMPKNSQVNAVSSFCKVYAAVITYPVVDLLNITTCGTSRIGGTVTD
jgi:hypothetical protein